MKRARPPLLLTGRPVDQGFPMLQMWLASSRQCHPKRVGIRHRLNRFRKSFHSATWRFILMPETRPHWLLAPVGAGSRLHSRPALRHCRPQKPPTPFFCKRSVAIRHIGNSSLRSVKELNSDHHVVTEYWPVLGRLRVCTSIGCEPARKIRKSTKWRSFAKNAAPTLYSGSFTQ